MASKYYPVLKWKKGEQVAVSELMLEQKQQIVPILEIVETLSLDVFIRTLSCYEYPVFIDTIFNDDISRGYLQMLVDGAHEFGKTVFPLYYPSDVMNPPDEIIALSQKCAIKTPILQGMSGPDINGIVRGIESFINLGKEVYLILDLGPTTRPDYINLQYNALISYCNNYASLLHKVSSIVIYTSSFPEEIGDIQRGEDRSYRRFDFDLFSSAVNNAQLHMIRDKLAFSDYGVTKFTTTDIDFRLMKHAPLPKIKYTTDNEYLVFKGERNNRTSEMTRSYIDLAREIVESQYFYGANFSFGDREIANKASGLAGVGNATNWVSYCANHHIAVLLQQISNLF